MFSLVVQLCEKPRMYLYSWQSYHVSNSFILGGREEGHKWSILADWEHYFLKNNSARNNNQYVPDLEAISTKIL